MAGTVSPNKYKLLKQAEVGPAALLSQSCTAFFFLLSTLKAQGPAPCCWLWCGFCAVSGWHGWTSLPRTHPQGASPTKPMILLPGYSWDLIRELLSWHHDFGPCIMVSCDGILHMEGYLLNSDYTQTTQAYISTFLLLIATRWGENVSLGLPPIASYFLIVAFQALA